MGAAIDTGPAVWSASGRDDAFDYWREVVCQAFTRLSPERRRDDAFSGEIRMAPFVGGASLSHITASPQTVARRREDVSAAPCDAVFVNFQISGSSVVRQRGIETRLPAGSLTLLDARQPFEMRFDEPFRQACLHVPMAWLAARSFDPAGALARRVDCPSLPGGSLMEDLVAGLGGIDDEGTARHFVHRLCLHYEGGGADTLADRHLALVRQYVADNCTDPDLDPRAVAGHFRMSMRYLHKLFARSNVSFGRFLLRCRLDGARRALAAGPDRSIAEVAAGAGFRSASHFTRSFARRYGSSPSALRRRADQP